MQKYTRKLVGRKVYRDLKNKGLIDKQGRPTKKGTALFAGIAKKLRNSKEEAGDNLASSDLRGD